MARWPIGLLLLANAGCDILWRIDPVPNADAVVGDVRPHDVMADNVNPGPITLVGFNSADLMNGVSAVTISVTMDNLPGNATIVAQVGWGSATTIVAFGDSLGETFMALPPVGHGQISQATYYTLHTIGGIATQFTATFSDLTFGADLRVIAYAGAGALDAQAQAVGSGQVAMVDVTTSHADAVIVAGATLRQFSMGSGAGFRTLMVTQHTGSIAEDAAAPIPTTTSVTAPQLAGTPDDWVISALALIP